MGFCYQQPDIIAAAAKSLQSCPTLCDPIDSSPPGSPVPGILQARTLEWGAIAVDVISNCAFVKIIAMWTRVRFQNILDKGILGLHSKT